MNGHCYSVATNILYWPAFASDKTPRQATCFCGHGAIVTLVAVTSHLKGILLAVPTSCAGIASNAIHSTIWAGMFEWMYLDCVAV